MVEAKRSSTFQVTSEADPLKILSEFQRRMSVNMNSSNVINKSKKLE